jgi:alkanesulfonate monooxygenase SsuD/methylene tetrahydromethanopterin reductase-like flavin-dependent oxidoreductase (luciferase family)
VKALMPMERAMLDEALAQSVVGSPETVRRGLEAFILATSADEIMITSQIFDHEARLRSFEITAGIRDEAEKLSEGLGASERGYQA